MNFTTVLNSALASRFDDSLINRWQQPCRPRVLIVADGAITYTAGNDFGLSRFLEAITVAPAVTNKPLLTLAHRNAHVATVTVGTDVYNVVSAFNFASAATAVTLANYDQIWLFGANSGAFGLSNAEVGVIATFMNGGGGLFATGDHAALGRELAGGLPRVRKMREYRDAATGGVPMGLEADATVAVNRIDTIVNPGANGQYEFEDQSDDIPQRIYPNYKVVDTDGNAGQGWSATVHPILMMPGAPAMRSSNDAAPSTEFMQDIDVLPDHAHESVCYELTPAQAAAAGNYTVAGQNFVEFQPLAANPALGQGVDLVAYGVSGGRAVFRSAWKPPVKPRMFGIISAYNGRLAQPYAGNTQRPGRIVCDSTWHHFLNVNLDGTGSGRNGLGTGSGAAFVPSPDLLKIYRYYTNTLAWLQPANRVWCSIFWDMVGLRLNASLVEELQEPERLTGWRDLVGVGRLCKALATSAQGRGAVRDQLLGLLAADARLQPLADALSGDSLAATPLDVDELLDGVYGGLLLEVARTVPVNLDAERGDKLLGKGVAPFVKALQDRLGSSLQLGLQHHAQRMERGMAAVKQLAAMAAK